MLGIQKEEIEKTRQVYFMQFFKEFESVDEVTLIKKKSNDFENEII